MEKMFIGDRCLTRLRTRLAAASGLVSFNKNAPQEVAGHFISSGEYLYFFFNGLNSQFF